MERIVYECSSVVKSFNQPFSRNNQPHQYSHHHPQPYKQLQSEQHSQHQQDYHIYRPKHFVSSKKFLQFARKLLLFLFCVCTFTCVLLYAFVTANCNTLVTLSGGSLAVIETDRLNDVVIAREFQRPIDSRFKLSSFLNLSNVFPFRKISGKQLQGRSNKRRRNTVPVPVSLNVVAPVHVRVSKSRNIRPKTSTVIPFRFAKPPSHTSGQPAPGRRQRKSPRRLASMAVKKQNGHHGLRTDGVRNSDDTVNNVKVYKYKKNNTNNKNNSNKRYKNTVRFVGSNRNDNSFRNWQVPWSANEEKRSDYSENLVNKTRERRMVQQHRDDRSVDSDRAVYQRYDGTILSQSNDLLSNQKINRNNKDSIKNSKNNRNYNDDDDNLNKEANTYNTGYIMENNNNNKSNNRNNSNDSHDIDGGGGNGVGDGEVVGERKGIYNDGRPLHIQRIRQNATKKLPQAIIIGVKKCGTRALLEYLRLHPDMKGTGPEPHFFDRHYYKGLEWYRKKMPATIDGQMTIEKTPSYFITKEVPKRIFNMSKEMKILVIVRDPVTRAISDYTQLASKRMNQMKRFEELAFLNTSTRIVDTSRNIIRIGVYAKFLERWLHYFPLSQMHFVSGEQLISDPAQELSLVQDFLGLKRIISEKHFYFNETKGFPCVKKAEGSGHPHCLGKTKGRPHPTVDPTILKRLRDFYRPFNTKFYQMVNRNFRWP
ncbi:putative uncharacterized protein DDB_G0277255 [Octopus sinensis]|uniref:Sulfotransferase domain-containing protein n=1 Tax=Octopus sinensis TaxID=2607531 RepID=A0A6P7SL82_9MOLL|nr:putative uncharacterized protein DDB_G0277255 [Octopus sinensis]XP_036360619.1 putative uncharacterized protein DDB_G0277255 [Octopus sinensis]XP_036360620.1 putative uncharacterized protein DDB_G0277255 [Octopus sinensis]XP_036360621.1 putative uncharacterized protein DDB_G0277255 [Octopus sinensis]XP_036360622.1 putative uncharacterized protein DDB_G0277255 [Octopus sinensis]